MSGRPATGGRVFVEAPARLHFGVLDLRGDLGRWFGGIGAAIPTPSLLLQAETADAIEAEGPDGGRAAEFARRYLARTGVRGGARIRVHRAIPAHAGLGSGTQLALAVARGLAELYGLPTSAPDLARAVERGRRSAIGTWAFEAGGFILEGGRRAGSNEVAPLLARHPMPASWHYVVAVPDAASGLSGAAEANAFRGLPAPPASEVERVAHEVLMRLLPAVAEADLTAFGESLSIIQRITGGWFAPAQGGVFAPGQTARLVRYLADGGAAGVGQSSWGPTVYALTDGAARADSLAAGARSQVGAGGLVVSGTFQNHGARAWPAGSKPLAD
ncbi:MAG TPA: beta-ribofuranosylaminobenzene 5'-phosphate synthase family protein [Gemmatimonadales bacterium]|nr:beta-ribofuranosylaminobenzene 5'-phosphate synthase family protein [Gemmatimonadales bacterium]